PTAESSRHVRFARIRKWRPTKGPAALTTQPISCVDERQDGSMNANVIAVVFAGLAVGPPVSAGQKPQTATRTVEARLQALEDKEAIHALLTTYGRTLDARDFAGFEQLFARDAEFVAGTGGTAKGPAAIRALLEGLLKVNAAPVSGRD